MYLDALSNRQLRAQVHTPHKSWKLVTSPAATRARRRWRHRCARLLARTPRFRRHELNPRRDCSLRAFFGSRRRSCGLIVGGRVGFTSSEPLIELVHSLPWNHIAESPAAVLYLPAAVRTNAGVICRCVWRSGSQRRYGSRYIHMSNQLIRNYQAAGICAEQVATSLSVRR